MTDNIAIRVEGLGKRYALGQQTSLTRSFRETLMTLPRFFLNKARQSKKRLAVSASHQEPIDPDTPAGTFWALRDASFEVNQGEVVGVIGRNGAGKSTLLKILSRITSPTIGNATIHGRVGSLLEVGTGFHPELTGRENIYLNGAILGMRKAEIARRFDDIVAFAEVERFLDMPVKRYSSGMYVRLAFAVAAHLEPEILIVDEVLSVGDALFQKKCLGKMGEVAQGGRTILFVSHNMTAVKNLCSRGILLEQGKITYMGSADDCVNRYMEELPSLVKTIPLADRKRSSHLTQRAKVIGVTLITSAGEAQERIRSDEPFTVRLTIEAYADLTCSVAFSICSQNQALIRCDSGLIHGRMIRFKKGISKIECQVGPTNLVSGDYSIACFLSVPAQEAIDDVFDAYLFNVAEMDPYKSGYNLIRTLAVYHVDHYWGELEEAGELS